MRVDAHNPTRIDGPHTPCKYFGGLYNFCSYQPFGLFACLGGTRKDFQLAIAATEVLPALVELGNVAQQAGQQRDMYALVILLLCNSAVRFHVLLAAGYAELGMNIAPFAHPHKGKVFALAQLP